MKTSLLSIILLIASVAVSSAQTLPSSLAVDFRTPTWAPADGQVSYTVGNITATSNYTGTIPNGHEGNNYFNIVQSSVDGFGVYSKATGAGYNEIDGYETLTISFKNGAGNNFSGVWVTDLFVESNNNVTAPEVGYAFLTTTSGAMSTITFTATETNLSNPGAKFIPLPANVASIKFYETPPTNLSNDYSVVGFQAIPEPSTYAMIFSLMTIGFVIIRKKLYPAKA